HQLALTMSLPFVHTARRSYRLNGPVKCSDRGDVGDSPPTTAEREGRPTNIVARAYREGAGALLPPSKHRREAGDPSRHGTGARPGAKNMTEAPTARLAPRNRRGAREMDPRLVNGPSSSAAFDLYNGSPLSTILSLCKSLSVVLLPQPLEFLSVILYNFLISPPQCLSASPVRCIHRKVNFRCHHHMVSDRLSSMGLLCLGGRWPVLSSGVWGRRVTHLCHANSLMVPLLLLLLRLNFGGPPHAARWSVLSEPRLRLLSCEMGEALTTDVAEDGKMSSLSMFGSALFPSSAAIRPSEVEMGQLLRMGCVGWTPPDNIATVGIDDGDDAYEKDVGDEAAIDNAWICPIGIGYKNHQTTMFSSDLEGTPIGGRDGEVRLMRGRMLLPIPVVAVLAGLRS
ncbi:hypothetical protein ACLOJK_004392, partial [Asimina triloba]